MSPSTQTSWAVAEFEHMLERLSMQDHQLRLARVRDAFVMAQELYGNSLHWTGIDFLTHAVGTLQVLLPFEPNEDAVIGCLLQHALDIREGILDEVQTRFGPEVRSIISGVHLLSHVTMRNRRMSTDSLRLMFLQVSDDIRVILITLCAHNYCLDQLARLSPDEGKRLCKDGLTLFAPVAARLGIYSLKTSIEARAFPVTYPTDAERIAQQIQDLHQRHGQFLEQVTHQLQQFLDVEGMTARIEAREKQHYSIFQKMQSKSINHVEDLYDLFAIRVIVETEAECYQVLGLLHRIGHPVQNRFKDYIGFPKPNGYQSLHTTLAKLPSMPEGLCLEVQIRTEKMHREAELGIAAHWSYKEGDYHAKDRLSKAVAFHEAIERGKSVLLDHLFVLTPRGDIIELPDGSTPLDFAFQVHSNLGLSFRSARVNGAIVPLTYQLQNGDIVEILRYRDPQPSPRWAAHLRTASARSRLRKYFAQQDMPANIAVGREMLNSELEKQGFEPLDTDLSLLRRVDGRVLSLTDREELLANIGQGTLKPAVLIPQIEALRSSAVRSPKQQTLKTILRGEQPIVQTEIPMPVRMAKCCKPDPAKRPAIIGIVSREGEIRVHAKACKFIRNGNPERRVKVRWS